MLEEPQGLFLTRTPRNLRVPRKILALRYGSSTFLLVMALAAIIALHRGVRPYRRLAARGVTVTGKITAMNFELGRQPPAWGLQYVFAAEDGASYQRAEEVLVSRQGEVRLDGPIEVTYDPKNPTICYAGRIDALRVKEEFFARWHLIAAVIVCLAGSVAIMWDWRRRTWLIRHGSVVQGQVRKLEEVEAEGIKIHRVTYAFTPDHLKDETEVSAEVSEEVYGRLREGARKLVFYDRSRPAERNVLYPASTYEIEEI